MRSFIISTFCAVGLATALSAPVMAQESVHLNAANWLGNLKLDASLVGAAKKAVEKALDAPIDSEQQCGPVRGDCVVRAAREWTVDGDRFREIVIYVHQVGQASNVVAQNNGKWPSIMAE